MLFPSSKKTIAMSFFLTVGSVFFLGLLTLFLQAEGVASQGGDDHGNTFGNATPIALGEDIAGTIDPALDWDYFRLDLEADSGVTDVWLYTSGDLDSFGILFNEDGDRIAYNDDGFVGPASEQRNFHLRWALPDGVYFVRVHSILGVPGNYTLHARSVSIGHGITAGTATSVDYGTPSAGTIRTSREANYYRLNVLEAMSLTIVSQGAVLYDGDDNLLAEPAIIQIFDGRGREVPVNTYLRVLRSGAHGRLLLGSTVEDDFSPGAYFVRVASPEGSEHFPDFEGSFPVPYTLFFYEDREYSDWVEQCSSVTNSLAGSAVADPLFGCQWHLNNLEAGGLDINVESVWAGGYLGQGVTVAVIDDSIDYSHEDLVENVERSKIHDVEGKGGAYRPYEHHGTSVAGVIAARDNAKGTRGVAPRVSLYGNNVIGQDEPADAQLTAAMSRNRVDTAVSNNSWGPSDGPGIGDPPSSFWERAIESGINEGFGGKGTFYAFAAGNGANDGDDANLDEVANFYAVTPVCAVGDGDVRASYSEEGANLWVCAPSKATPGGLAVRGIVTTENSDRYERAFSGTSASTPVVSGVAALLRQVNPELTWRDLKLVLAGSARKNDPDNQGWEDGAIKYGSESQTERFHYNYEYGFGMVDAGAAVELAREWENLPLMLVSEEVSPNTLDLRIPDATGTGTVTSVSDSLTIASPIRFIEYVEIEADLNHESLRDLELELESPSGTVSRLLAPFDTREVLEPVVINGVRSFRPLFVPLDREVRLGSAKHLGENANGEWTLRISDNYNEKHGVLHSWSLKIYGHASGCAETVVGDQSLSGEWDSGKCESSVRAGSPSRYYRFTLAQESAVTVDLESAADTYLYLRSGESQSGAALYENDDEVSESTNSRISGTLSAGTYTVEATTYNPGETGSFTLTITGLDPIGTTDPDPEPTDQCGEVITADGATPGTWPLDCRSEVSGRGYAQYYRFTLGQVSEVTIDLESSIDTYLYLRRGESRSGSALYENDDVESGNTNSRLRETLSAGTYTIEATTYSPGETGSYTLTIRGLATGGTTDPGPEPIDQCGESLNVDATISGQWAVGCQSQETGRGYARYYRFTLGQESEVTIDLQSTRDSYLYLRSGESRSGTALYENDDVESGNTNSQINVNLAAGTYTIEATTYTPGEAGGFTLTVSGLGLGGATEPDPEPADQCGESVIADGRATDTWTTDCRSEVAGRGYARYYTFTLAQESEVAIDLQSTRDTYLYLRSGETRSGTALHENDDVESGNTNSRISEALAAGTYTIEATTYNPGETGSFTLTVSGLGPDGTTQPGPLPSDLCEADIVAEGAMPGAWTTDCQSEVSGRGYAKYYTFTLEQRAEVTIDLESSVDTYLYLRSGESRSGMALHENDDVGSGNTNSRISETLAIGTYTIEATTYNPNETGSFTLTVTGLGTGDGTDQCGVNITVDGPNAGTWSTDCQSQVEGRGYARYYVFTLAQGSHVTIDLQSTRDTYLYLRRGESRGGAGLHENDDVESGNTNSRISETLGAGTFTIEATTYSPNETGTFTLTVTGLGTGDGSDRCGVNITVDGPNAGTWSTECDSQVEGRGYAEYYTITLDQESEVTIDLESSVDTYLYLRSGESRSGMPLYENDDVESGNTDSRISETLAAGTYTIEATTYSPGETGSFTLSISGLGNSGS